MVYTTCLCWFDGCFLIVLATLPNGWLVYFMENPMKLLTRTRILLSRDVKSAKIHARITLPQCLPAMDEILANLLLGPCTPKWARKNQIMWCCVFSRPIFGVGYPVDRHWVYHMAFCLGQYSDWTLCSWIKLNPLEMITQSHARWKCGLPGPVSHWSSRKF